MELSEVILNPQKLEEIFKKVLRKKDKELAHVLVNYVDDPYLVYEYAKKIVGGKVDDKLEDIIARDSDASTEYAVKVLHKPFPKGEDAIAEEAANSYKYVNEVLKRPWPKGEDHFANYTVYSYWYAHDILKKPWPKGEDAIARSSTSSVAYAVNVLHGPFIKGEKAIMEDDENLRYYLKFLQSIGKLDEFYERHPELKNKEIKYTFFEDDDY